MDGVYRDLPRLCRINTDIPSQVSVNGRIGRADNQCVNKRAFGKILVVDDAPADGSGYPDGLKGDAIPLLAVTRGWRRKDLVEAFIALKTEEIWP